MSVSARRWVEGGTWPTIVADVAAARRARERRRPARRSRRATAKRSRVAREVVGGVDVGERLERARRAARRRAASAPVAASTLGVDHGTPSKIGRRAGAGADEPVAAVRRRPERRRRRARAARRPRSRWPAREARGSRCRSATTRASTRGEGRVEGASASVRRGRRGPAGARRGRGPSHAPRVVDALRRVTRTRSRPPPSAAAVASLRRAVCSTIRRWTRSAASSPIDAARRVLTRPRSGAFVSTTIDGPGTSRGRARGSPRGACARPRGSSFTGRQEPGCQRVTAAAVGGGGASRSRR